MFDFLILDFRLLNLKGLTKRGLPFKRYGQLKFGPNLAKLTKSFKNMIMSSKTFFAKFSYLTMK